MPRGASGLDTGLGRFIAASNATGCQAPRENSRQLPGTPLSSCSSRSTKWRSEPTTRSTTVRDTSTSPGPAFAWTRSSDMYGDARDVVSAPFNFACVYPNADRDTQLAKGIADRGRRLHGPGGTVEDGQHSITGPFDQMPVKSRKLAINRPIVLFEKRCPRPITDCTGLLCRSHDVEEEDRRQKAIMGGHLSRPGQKLLDLTCNVRSARPRDVVCCIELDIASASDMVGEIAAVVDSAELRHRERGARGSALAGRRGWAADPFLQRATPPAP